MIRKNLMKSLSVIMAAMLAVMTVACGKASTEATTAIETAAQAKENQKIEQTIETASAIAATESEAGKVETVYVTADANGAVNDVIVSEWLKNATASSELSDTTELKDIVNVKGSETFKDNGDGTLTWDAEGEDIYYQGTTDKELPVSMKITYTLDGKEISPEELAGKSGKVTIRFEYENNAKQTVEVNGKDIEVYTPFAMVSGMMLDANKFTNVEISNGKVISDGGNYVVMGVATPGLKESLDISDDKWEKLEDGDEIKDKLSNSFEITADTTDFQLGMTITMASSDILSDFGMSDLTASDEIDKIKDDMGELQDGSTKLVDGTKELKDGTTTLRDGTGKLYDGTTDLADGARKLYSGATELSDGTSQLFDGTGSLADGAAKLYTGTGTLKDGTGSLKDGTDKLYDGVKAYTDGASKIKDGAASLADGIKTAKAGSSALKQGMDNADIVNNAGKISKGAEIIGPKLQEMGTMISGLSDTMAGLAQVVSTYQNVCAAEEYLNGKCGWSDAVAAGLSIASNGAIADEATAQDLIGAKGKVEDGAAKVSEGAAQLSQSLAGFSEKLGAVSQALPSTSGSQENASQGAVSQDPNYDENVVEVTTETITKDEEDTKEEVVAQPAEEKVVESEQKPEVEPEAETEAEPVQGETTQKDASADETPADDVDGQGVSTQTYVVVSDPVVSAENADSMISTTKAVPLDDGSVILTPEEYAQYQELLSKVSQYEAMMGQISSLSGSLKALYAGAQTLSGSSASLATGAAGINGGLSYYGQYYQVLGAVQGIKGALKPVVEMAESMDFSEEKVEALKSDLALLQQFVGGSQAISNGVVTLYGATVQIDDGLTKISSGANTLAEGSKTLTSKNSELLSGVSQLKDGAVKLDNGAGELKDGAGQLSDGASQLKDGAGKLNNGAHELSDGAGKLSDGANDLNNGAKELNDGVITLDDGVQELLDGVCKLDEEGIQKLYEAFDGDLTDFTDRMTAIQEAGKQYKSFGGSNDDVDSSVKFIIKTDSIKEL